MQMWKQTIGQEGAAIKQPLHLKAQSVPDKKKTKQKKANAQTNDKNLITLMVFEVGRKKKPSRELPIRHLHGVKSPSGGAAEPASRPAALNNWGLISPTQVALTPLAAE